MGGKGGAPSIGASPLSKEQAKFLKQQRQDIIEPGQAALFPAALPGAVGALSTSLSAQNRQALESQHNQALSNIMSRGTRGGLMQRMMTTADLARADTVGNAINQARELGQQRSLGLLGPAIFPGASQTIAAGQAAAQGDEARRLQNAQMQAQAGQSKGAGLGGLMSLGSMFA